MRKGRVDVRSRLKRLALGEQARGLQGAARGRALRLIAGGMVVLVVGVAGTASAGVLVGSRQVKDGSLTGRDLKAGTIRGSDVRDGSLKPRDFGVVPQGLTGPQGDPGDPGSNGDPSATTENITRLVPGNSTEPFEMLCIPPQKAIMGGARAPSAVDLLQSAPAIDGARWTFVLRNRSVVDQQVSLSAVCVTDR